MGDSSRRSDGSSTGEMIGASELPLGPAPGGIEQAWPSGVDFRGVDEDVIGGEACDWDSVAGESLGILSERFVFDALRRAYRNIDPVYAVSGEACFGNLAGMPLFPASTGARLLVSALPQVRLSRLPP